MMWFSILAAAIAPGLALLAYFYLKDRYETEPISMVARLFLFGGLLVFPTMVLQRSFVLGFGDNSFLFSFVFSAGLEEFMKWFVVFYIIYKHTLFDEPYDGIVYAVALSLGFATVENVIYAFINFTTFSNLMMRAFLPVSGHALFGVMMGYYLGMAKFNNSKATRYLMLSFLLPLLYHGVFDYVLLNLQNNWLWLMLPLMILMWIRSLWKVNSANSISPFRFVHREDKIKI
jgi:RsiW-degrading membrane proteinase PrsW (M82 family)